MRFRFLPSLLLVGALGCAGWAHAQPGRCASDSVHTAQLTDTAFARSYFAFEAAIAEMATSAYRSSQTYTLPVVVHIMHDGDDIGTGSNIPEAQVISAIDALNADFQGAFGGADIDIEFALAVRDPNGQPTTGINRINVPQVIPSFASTGMVTSLSSDPASEMNIKALSHWPGDQYINVWVLASMNGGLSPLGFAYLPPTSGMHDGIVVHHQVFGVGEEFDLVFNYDLNRTLTHEVGHYLSLLHTFNATASCGAETNCGSQGDRVCDTPPTTGSIGCSAIECPETMVENFMDYSNDPCMDSFTEGQRTRMRDALVAYRSSLLDSEALIPVSPVDVGIASVEGLASSGCASTIQPLVTLQNFGSDPITTADIHFSLDGGPVNVMGWTGNLASGASVELTLPGLAAPEGDHELTLFTVTDGDGQAVNDTVTSTFSVLAGSNLTLEVQFDALPFGISWEIVHTADGTVVADGGDYDNSTYGGSFISEDLCAVNGCYELIVEDLFGNGMHYFPPGWYALTDGDGNELGAGSGNFGAEQVHAFCLDGGAVEPCEDLNGNDICDVDEDLLNTDVPGCTDPASCTYDSAANTDDGSCQYLDALGDCGGDCPSDNDGDGVCDNAEIPGCTDDAACNYEAGATEEAGNCTYPEPDYDCDGNLVNVIPGCTDDASCTYDSAANTDDGSCQYLDALGDCGGDCPSDNDGDGVCDNAEIPGCTDDTACNYEAGATEEAGNCTYPEPGLDCNGDPLSVIPGCTDPFSCTYDSAANADDGSCEYFDALGDCGGDCPADIDGDGVCDNAEIPGCTDPSACNFDETATEENGNCDYPAEGYDCDGNLINVVLGCTDPASCTYDAEANTDDGSCEYLDALGDCGGDCEADVDGDGVCDDAEIEGCTDEEACNYDGAATEADGSCEYAEEGYDCDGNPLTSSIGEAALTHAPLRVFPNPASGGPIHIAGLNESGTYGLDVLDGRGRILQQVRLTAQPIAGGWGLVAPLSLPAGWFILQVRPAQGHSATRTVRLAVH